MVSDAENASRFRYYCGSVRCISGVTCRGFALPWHSGGANQIYFSPSFLIGN
jgi:hypothetical protein